MQAVLTSQLFDLVALGEEETRQLADAARLREDDFANIRLEWINERDHLILRLAQMEHELQLRQQALHDQGDVTRDKLRDRDDEIKRLHGKILKMEDQLSRDREVVEKALGMVEELQERQRAVQVEKQELSARVQDLEDELLEKDRSLKKMRRQLDEQRSKHQSELEQLRIQHRQELFVLEKTAGPSVPRTASLQDAPGQALQ